jgi:AcrR family transcriptional regulator
VRQHGRSFGSARRYSLEAELARLHSHSVFYSSNVFYMKTAARLTRPERKARTRQALIEAGARLFARDGFAGARVEEIAAQAGVTTGALYAQFAGKEALFLAVYEKYAAQRVREVGEAGLQAPNAALTMRAAADQWMARFDTEPWALRLHMEFAEYVQRDPQLREDFALRVGAVRGAVARLIEQQSAASGRDLPLSVDSLAAVLRALGIGLAVERLVDPEAIPAELFGDFVEALFQVLFAEDGDR